MTTSCVALFCDARAVDVARPVVIGEYCELVDSVGWLYLWLIDFFTLLVLLLWSIQSLIEFGRIVDDKVLCTLEVANGNKSKDRRDKSCTLQLYYYYY